MSTFLYPQYLSPQEAAAINLRRLLALRSIAIAGQITVVFVARNYLGLDIPTTELGLILGMQVLVNLLTYVRVTTATHIRDIELFSQLLLDVAALTAMLYFTGGSTNPFTLLYLLPLVLTAAALPGTYTWFMVAITISSYSLLMFHYVELPHVHHGSADDFNLHVFGMWLGFVLSALLIAFFAVRMTQTLRSKDHALAELRERHMQNERIVAIGTLAAAAAHELGTPLSTMAIIAREIEQESSGTLKAQLSVISKQITRCKKILSTLSTAAGNPRAGGTHTEAFADFVLSTVDDWLSTRPDAKVNIVVDPQCHTGDLIVDETLGQSIGILLNNAADASAQNIDITLKSEGNEFVLCIADRGSGMAPQAKEAAGRATFSTKAQDQGMGLGLFLAFTTIERLGGRVTLLDREGGGIVAMVRIPIHSLQVQS